MNIMHWKETVFRAPLPCEVGAGSLLSGGFCNFRGQKSGQDCTVGLSPCQRLCWELVGLLGFAVHSSSPSSDLRLPLTNACGRQGTQQFHPRAGAWKHSWERKTDDSFIQGSLAKPQCCALQAEFQLASTAPFWSKARGARTWQRLPNTPSLCPVGP